MPKIKPAEPLQLNRPIHVFITYPQEIGNENNVTIQQQPASTQSQMA